MIEGIPFLFPVLIVILLACLAIQCWFYLVHFNKIAKQQPQKTARTEIPVTVIVCARNEADNLKDLIPALCEQDYPTYEVLIVNDRSTDNSESILNELKNRYPALRVVQHRSEASPGKKAALKFGIENAAHEILLFTDADCLPTSKKWIESMVATFDLETDLVLGFSPYKKSKGLLNQFIQYETYLTALQYFSWASVGKAYMGVGRNLAYKKSAFLKSDQFESSLALASGDDDLMVQQISTASNTKAVCRPEAITISKAPQQFSLWWKQKMRHLSTGTTYPKSVQRRLGAFSGSLILFYLTGIACILIAASLGNLQFVFVISSLFILRWLFMMVCNESLSPVLKLRNFALFIPFYDFLFFFYLVAFAPFLFYNPTANTWNKKWIDSYS